MQKYIALDLLSGIPKRTARKPMICFLIVNKEHESDFIKKTALGFLEQGTWYHFYGQYEPIWHRIFDETDIMVYPNSTPETVTTTCGYGNLEEFAEEIHSALHTRYFVPTDVLLFYDDDEIYTKLKAQLALMEKTMDFTQVTNNLERLGYKVSCFESGEAAAEYLTAQLVGKKVAFGGSVTVEQLGLYERLAARNEVIWHHRIPEGKTSKDMRLAARSADVYISSVNGLAESGEIINIDGTGNRVAAICYGHEKVYLLVGKNKLAKDYDAALWRARNVASPKNAQRLGMKTPCAVNADKCYNCASPDRICRALSVLWEKPMLSDVEILLIGEELGY